VAEALAYGDMGLALPILAPGGVATALTNWGSADQQTTYLTDFAGEHVPQACVAIAEPQALFDPMALKATAVRTPSGYRLHGVKSLVPAAADAELFIVGAQLNGKPALFIVESSSRGLTLKADPSMGIRAAALGQVELDNVTVPLGARLGEDEATEADYSEAVALSRLGWAALAVGTSHAVLDYVVPYVKERQAFGEPIAHRQSVAFMCANIAIELDGLRLIDSPVWRDRLAKLQARVLAMQFHGLRLLTARLRGENPGVAGLIVKLMGCELNHQLAAFAIDALGELGVLYDGGPHLRAGGNWQRNYMFDLGLIIGGGTAQIQKNIISERGLGMPREPKLAN